MIVNIWGNCYYKQVQEKRSAVLALQLTTMENVCTFHLWKSDGIILL